MEFAEIKTALEQKPDMITQIVSSFKDLVAKGLAAEGMIVRTKEDDQSFLDNHVNTVVTSKVNEQLPAKVAVEFGKAMGEIDGQIKELTGLEKNNGEKTTAYAKRALESIKAKGGDPVTKARVEELERMMNEQKSTYEQKLTDLEKSSFDREIDFMVNAELDRRSYHIPQHLKTEEEKQKHVAQEKDMIKRSYLGSLTAKKDNDKGVVFYDGDKPLLNTKDGKALQVGEILDDRYASRFVPKQHQQQGTGTGQGSGGASGGFKSKDDIHAHLQAQGVAAGSKEYMDQYQQLATDNKVAI